MPKKGKIASEERAKIVRAISGGEDCHAILNDCPAYLSQHTLFYNPSKRKKT